MEIATILVLVSQSLVILEKLVDLLKQQGVSAEQLAEAIANAKAAHTKLQETK